MSRKNENSAFVCIHCGKKVVSLTNGSYRNHCPFCLYSRHVDLMPGDRQSICKGLMAPISLHHGRKGIQIRHRCLKCGVIKLNKIAENTIQPDNIDTIVSIIKKGTF